MKLDYHVVRRVIDYAQAVSDQAISLSFALAEDGGPLYLVDRKAWEGPDAAARLCTYYLAVSQKILGEDVRFPEKIQTIWRELQSREIDLRTEIIKGQRAGQAIAEDRKVEKEIEAEAAAEALASAQDDRLKKLAQELIEEVERKLAMETSTLQRRIREALVYMSGVQTPNTNTLYHIRRYLTGEYDGSSA